MNNTAVRALLCLLPLLTARTALQAKEPADDRFQPIDVFKLEYASDPQVSPDGKQVVYVRNSMDIMKDRPRSRLWIINVDGSDHRPLTSGDANESSPRWSPDGKRLLFVSDAGGTPQLHCRWMDRGDTTQLTRLPSGPINPAWSPDGKAIAFTMFVEEPEQPFVELPGKPEGAEWAKPPKVIRKSVYRFDGKGYLKNGHHHLFIVPAEGGAPRQLTHGPYDHLQTFFGGPMPGPSWAPDGKAIILSANRHPDAARDVANTEVYEVSVADGKIKVLTDRKGPDDNAVLSPEGKHIAYSGFTDKGVAYQMARLHIMNRDGTGQRVLDEKHDREAQSFVWSKDGNGLYIQYGDRGNNKIGFINLQGEVKTLAENVGGTEISRPYSSGSFSVGGDGVLAFTLAGPDRPGDVAVRTPKDAKPRRLTALNDNWLRDRTLGSVEEMWYESSHDRRKIHGWIVKPPHFDPKKKYPLILEIHGGPQADYGANFTAEIQLYAAAGYVVLYTNPRGSTSYGEAFTQLINGAYPGHDYDDLMSGVDDVLKRGYVDADNLFVTGGSGGGILTAWIVGKTKRFRAAVAAKAIVNWYSAVLTSDSSPFDVGHEFPRHPWESAEDYLKRSPISLVGNVSTPTMLLTGEEDYRCPISEAEQFYAALKLRNVETALVRIPEASHAIVDRPSRLIAKVACILKWFETHRLSAEKVALSEELLSAARKGDVAMVRALLIKGADVNARSSYGVTALSFAADKGHLDVVKLLLEQGADVNTKDRFYNASPIDWASMHQHPGIVKALVEAGANGAAAQLPAAAAAGNIELVRIILDQTRPNEGILNNALAMTPAKHTDIAELLKKAGAKPPAPKTEVAIERELLLGAPGIYRADAGIEVKIAANDGKLSAQMGGGPAMKLLAVDKTSLKSEDGATTFAFRRENDKVAGLTMKADKMELSFRRVDDSKEPAPGAPRIEDKGGIVKVPLNWPSFRGPNASGVADGQFPPISWDVDKKHNVRWKTPIPGLGHSCPVVWGDRIYLTTAVSNDGKAEFKPGLYGDVEPLKESTEHTWRVYCIDKNSGRIIWERTACKGVPKVKRHPKGSHANPTPASDGTHIVVSFGSEGLYCYDPAGTLLWRKSLGMLDSGWFYDADYQWGFGSSPIIYHNLVIVQCDVGKDSFIAAYRVADGQEVWRKSRAEIPSWGTPTIVEAPGRAELVTNATKFARGYDPLTGEELWRLGRHAEITVPTPIFGQGLVFITSGYRPVQPIYAIRPGARGDITLKDGEKSNTAIAWSTTRDGPYMPTPIVYGDYLYLCSNAGMVTCFDAKTGKQIYKERLGGGGGYTASPVAADGKLYFTGEESGVRVVRAGPKFEVLAVNPLGDACMTTPAISDGMMFIRTQHYLLGLGRNAAAKP
jgi:dipeptidyl aminopeptidase/acylaminoacyl peptidase/ankyrin repeat protein/outer membrane protein assembly factor BamB